MRLSFFYIDGGIHPKLGPVFYRAAKAIGRGPVERYNQYLCQVLNAVAQDVDECDCILNYINDVESGKQLEVETGGNDVTLTLKCDGIQVDIQVNEDWIGQSDGHFELDEWRKALVGWRRLLQMPQSVDSFFEIDI